MLDYVTYDIPFRNVCRTCGKESLRLRDNYVNQNPDTTSSVAMKYIDSEAICLTGCVVNYQQTCVCVVMSCIPPANFGDNANLTFHSNYPSRLNRTPRDIFKSVGKSVDDGDTEAENLVYEDQPTKSYESSSNSISNCGSGDESSSSECHCCSCKTCERA